MDDEDLVHDVASEFVKRLGHGAIAHIDEQLDLALERDDELSAKAWQDIRIIAAALLGASAEGQADSDAAASATILIVEDDQDVLQSLAMTLSNSGHQVLRASSGFEALKLLHSRTQIDVLLTDVMIPDPNGFSLATMAVERRPGLKVLYLTGFGEMVLPMGDRYDRYGKLLMKPVSPEVLREEVACLMA